MSRADGRGCKICLDARSVMHSHHTVPRSRGGADSMQIPLCSNCHNTLHANAVAILARLRRKVKPGKKQKPLKRFWPDDRQEARAAPWLKILVEALMLPIAPGYVAQHPVHLSVDTPLFEMMKLLQQDIGASSMEKMLYSAVQLLANERGINVGNNSDDSGGTANLWFLQRPATRAHI